MPDKTRILIAIEPHGEFCNAGAGPNCPFVRKGNAMAIRISFSCAIFGGDLETVGATPLRMIKRHPACIEAQKDYNEGAE